VAAEADHLGHDPGDLRGGVELPLALAALGGEVFHEVLVGVAEEVVTLGAVGAKVDVLEDADEFGEAVLHLLAAAELAGVVKVGLVDDALEVVGLGEARDDRVDSLTDVGLAPEPDHVVETTALGDVDEEGRVGSSLVGDVLHEQQGEDVVLVL
jgi:hypothetical protein